MSLLRNPPEKLAIYALSAYGLSILLTVFNVICSYLYFRTVAPGGDWVGMTIAIGIALLVNIIESGTIMVFLSSDEAGHLFTPPRMTIAGFPNLISKLIKFGIIGVFGFALAWTYSVDLSSTKAVLGASGSIGNYVVVACVLGSEFLMILGHTLWGLSKASKANTVGIWSMLNAQLGKLNTVQMPQKPPTAQPEGKPAAQPEGRRLAEKVRRGA